MKALLYEHPGGPDVLEYRDVADPEPGPQDVVVDVAATALNHLDVVQRNGWFTLPGFTLPHIAGMDLAGTVSTIGSRGRRRRGRRSGRRRPVARRRAGGLASSPAMGDFYGELGVIGGTVAGGYAERCLVPSTARPPRARRRVVARRRRLPDRLPDRPPRPVRDRATSAFGETVLIHAAGSGVSTAAIQLARHAGATVLATAGTDEKCERALAHRRPSRRRTTATIDVAAWAREVTDGVGVDMVFDHVGPALWEASLLRAQAARPARQLRQHDRRLGDDPVARPPVPHGHLDHRLRPVPPPRVRRRLAAVPATAASTSPIDSVFAARRRGGGAGEAAAQRRLRQDPAASPEPPMADSPYPELKKTHTMAHTGRPWRDHKPPPSAPVWAIIQGFGSYWVAGRGARPRRVRRAAARPVRRRPTTLAGRARRVRPPPCATCSTRS